MIDKKEGLKNPGKIIIFGFVFAIYSYVHYSYFSELFGTILKINL